MKNFLKTVTVIIGVISITPLIAQPSGGPYGPIQKNYDIPDVFGTIYYVSPDGKDESAGTSVHVPASLESVITKVKTGDAIILRGGVYRTGDLQLNQSIIMQPYQDEQPVIKGTNIARDWIQVVPPLGNQPGLWKTKWPHLFASAPDNWWRKELRGRETPLHKFNNDMVFVDGQFLQSAGWLGELNNNSFFIDYTDQYVYIATDPTNKLVEITAFNQGLIITSREVNGKKADGKGPVIRGITFSQYAFHVIDIEGYDPEGLSKESEHGKDVVGTTIENCLVSFGGRVGAFLHGDGLTIRNCKFSDTSTEGVYILSSSDILLERNIFTRNNIENITGYYPAAVKIFNQTHRVTCNDNLIIDLPNSNGIWYDVGNEDGVFTNNWLENVGTLETEFTGQSVWPSQNAFFFEISKRAIVAGNVFVNDDHGLLILNSSDVSVYNNTFINSVAAFGRDRRGEDTDHFGWHVTTGPNVEGRINHKFVDNLMVADENFKRPLLFVWQMPDQCKQLKEPALAELNHNVYVKLNSNNSPIIWIAQKIGDNCVSTFNSTDELNQVISKYESNGASLLNYNGPLCRSIELKNFELLDDFKDKTVGTELPEKIKEVLKNNSTSGYVGAYPTK